MSQEHALVDAGGYDGLGNEWEGFVRDGVLRA